jgi:hypothetical protein
MQRAINFSMPVVRSTVLLDVGLRPYSLVEQVTVNPSCYGAISRCYHKRYQCDKPINLTSDYGATRPSNLLMIRDAKGFEARTPFLKMLRAT